VRGIADSLPVSSVGPQAVKQLRVTVVTVSVFLPTSSGKIVVSGGAYVASLLYTHKQSKSISSGYPHLQIHFCGNNKFKNSVTSLWNCGTFLEQHIIYTPFLYKRHGEFLQHIWLHYASYSTMRHYFNCECSSTQRRLLFIPLPLDLPTLSQ
jgi:hypothetical protein